MGNTSGQWIGVAPDAELVVGKVLGRNGGTDAQVLAGMTWAVEQAVDAINMSLGGLVLDAETPPVHTNALLTSLQAGIPVVAAIGNEGSQTTGLPGNDLFAFSVGATDHLERPAGFSGGRAQLIRESDFIRPEILPLPYSKPEISAPGVAVVSSVPATGMRRMAEHRAKLVDDGLRRFAASGGGGSMSVFVEVATSSPSAVGVGESHTGRRVPVAVGRET